MRTWAYCDGAGGFPANLNEGQTHMRGVIATLIGLLIVIVAVGIPYWLTQHMRSQHDLGEMEAYAKATDRSADNIAAGAPSRGFDHGSRAAREWSAAHAGVDPETGERAPKPGSAGWPEGTG
jgi:hypothetical protein